LYNNRSEQRPGQRLRGPGAVPAGARVLRGGGWRAIPPEQWVRPRRRGRILWAAPRNRVTSQRRWCYSL